MKKFLLSLLLCVVLVVVGFGISGRFALMKQSNRQAQAEPVVTEKLPNVAVQVLRAKDVEDVLYLTGIVEPWEDVTISAETRGKIEWQGIEEGDRVQENQELIRVNTRTIQANIDQANAEFVSAERELTRIEGTRKTGISSPQEHDKALMARDSARAKLQLAEIQMEQSVIRAPFDGVVDTLEKEAGEFVDSGTPLVRVVQINRVKIVAGLPEREVANFTAGDRVDMIFDALPGEVIRGHVFQIATSAELTTRTFPTEIAVDNADRLLRPGMVARVKLVRQVLEDALTVPLFAIMKRDETSYVVVEDDGLAVERPVTVGFMRGEAVHIAEGLNDGDRLIVAGQRDLRDGTRVAVQRVTEGQ